MVRLRTAELREVLDAAASATTANDKGALYQRATELVFGSVPGVQVMSVNDVSAFASEELDVGLYVGDVPRGFPLTELVVPLEEKNWDGPLDAQGLDWFVSKLRRRSLNLGILIAANGITGDPVRRTAAQDILQSALGNGISILVLTDEELRAFRTTTDVVDALKRALVRLRLRRSSL